jgi:hypothetical protein
MPLPFLMSCEKPAPTLFELSDGRFQLMEQVPVPPLIAGYGYLLVEQPLALRLKELHVERVKFEPAVLFNPVSGEEQNALVRLRVGQFFRSNELSDFAIEGLRLLTLNDQYYFVSPALKVQLENGAFPYLRFSEGLSEFAGSAT